MMWNDHRYTLPRCTGDVKEDVISLLMLLGTIAFVLGLSKFLAWLMETIG